MTKLTPLKGMLYTHDDRGVAFQKGITVGNGVYIYPEEALEVFRRRGLDKNPLTILTKVPHLYSYFYSMFALESQGIEAEEIVTIVSKAWIALTNGFRSEDPSKLPMVSWDVDGCFTHPTGIGRKRRISEIRPDLTQGEEGFDIWGE